MKKAISKLLSLISVCCLLFSVLAVFSFAKGQYESAGYTNLIEGNVSKWTFTYDLGTRPTVTYDSTNGTRINFANSTGYRLITSYTFVSKLSINATYQLSFEAWGRFDKSPTSLVVLFYDADGNIISNTNRPTVNLTKNINTDYQLVGGTFVPATYIGNNTISKIEVKFIISTEDTGGGYNSVYLRNVELINTAQNVEQEQTQQQIADDTAGILDWVSRIYHSIVGGTDSQGVQHDGLVKGIKKAIDNISTWISDAVDSIGAFFSDLTTSIGDFFSDLGNDILDFFIMLKNYILYFQDPVTINADGVPVDGNGDPIYENPFEEPDFFATIQELIEEFEQSKTDVENGTADGVQALQNTVAPFSSLISSVPYLSMFFVFAMAIIIIKKVIG